MKEEGGRRKEERGSCRAVGGVERSEAHRPASSFILHPSSFILHPSSFRRRGGISLLEVLIAIFVLSVGLLTLAMLIPAGQVSLLETNKADRSGACGRAGLQEVKIRRILESHRWDLNTPTQEVQMWLRVTNENFTIDSNFDLDDEGPVTIDPWGIATVASRHDPPNYDATTMLNFPCDPAATVTMPRLTLRAGPYTSAGVLTLVQAEGIFRWRDDLLFVRPDDATLRPVSVPPAGPPQHQGDYSWMITVVPASTDLDMDADQRQLFTVSIVVFYKRDPVAEAERVYKVEPGFSLLGGGWGGGTVRLLGLADVRRDEWIMLCHNQPSEFGGTFKWYRVLSAARDRDNGLTTLSLAGPDWTLDTDGNGIADVGDDQDPQVGVVQAVVVEDVVGVYTKTVEVNQNSVWTK